jgi:hypothetical protein
MFIKLSLLLVLSTSRPARIYEMGSLCPIICCIGIVHFECLDSHLFLFPAFQVLGHNRTVSGHCMSASSQQTLYEANGVLNIVTDILIYLTPIPMLWKVQIPLVRLEIYPSFREKPLTQRSARRLLLRESLDLEVSLLPVRLMRCIFFQGMLIVFSRLRAICLCEEASGYQRPVL